MKTTVSGKPGKPTCPVGTFLNGGGSLADSAIVRQTLLEIFTKPQRADLATQTKT